MAFAVVVARTVLSAAMTTHQTIKLKPKEGRRARAGAPWIFSNEIQMDAAAKALPPGTVVNVAGR